MLMKQKNYRILLIVGIIYILAFLYCSTYDLPVSLWLTSHANEGFIYFGRCISILPGVYVGCFCAGALANNSKRTIKYFYTLIALIMAFVVVYEFSHYSGNQFISVISILVGIILFIVTMLLTKQLTVDNLQKKRLLQMGILLLAITNIIIECLKLIWGRPRFYSLVNPQAEFVPWLTISGIASGDAFKSFPSGHTANATLILWYSFLPIIIPSLKKYHKLLVAVGLGWIICTATSRIMAGDHFLSDVMIGHLIAVSIIIILAKLVIPNDITKTIEGSQQ